MIFTNTFAQYEKLLHQKYAVSSTIRHRGERGRQREHGLFTFLKDNLPGAYGVATGEVIPYRGSIPSPQCDIIIYDRLRMPVLGSGEAVQQVPLEAVYGIIECKSSLDSKAFIDAKEKFHAIRSLPRCPSKRPLREAALKSPFFTLFGYRLKATTKRCKDFMELHAVHQDIDVVALDSGCGIWVEDRPKPVWLNSTEAKIGNHETLIIFFVGLLQTLQAIDLGEPNYLEMFYSNE